MRIEEIKHLEDQADLLQRLIWKYENQIALRGSSVDPHVLIEREDTEAELKSVRKQIAELRNLPVGQQSPYVGLLTFQEDDADRFFGRGALIATLLAKLGQSPFLAVLGPSGSGKSSVVRAGLLPELKRGALLDSERWIYCPPLRPGTRPLNSLAAVLTNLPHGTMLGSLFDLQERLATRADALLVAADGLRNGDASIRLVLVIDQAEELWTLAPSDPELHKVFVEQQQSPFIRLLIHALQASDSPIVLVFTMRADFLHRAAEHPELAYLIGEHDLIVSPLTPEELRAAIALPAEAVGGHFQDGLEDELVEQTVNRPGALPLLEYTLQELWKRRSDDGTLTWVAFNELGGVEGALAARADAILAEHYSVGEQEQLRKLLVQLVQPGEGAADTRRRVILADLAPSGIGPDIVQSLLMPLVNERLLTTGYDPHSDNQTVELAHEALIRAWPTFNGWINAAREDLRFQLQLDDDAHEWVANGESADFLWSGLRLANANAWLKSAAPQLNARDRAFLDASRAAEEARQQAEENARQERERLLEERAAAEARNVVSERRNVSRLRIFLAIAAVLLLIVAGLAIYTLRQTQQANAARIAAEVQVDASESLFESGLGNLDRAILLAQASIYNNNPLSSLAVRAMRETTQRSVPNRPLQGHTDSVLSVAWSPDGKQMLTGSADKTAKIWDLVSGRELTTLQGHTDIIYGVAWSPNGKQVLTGSGDKTAKIWEVASGKEFTTLQGHTDRVLSVAWSPDGKRVLTGSFDNTAKIWDVASGKELTTLQGHTDSVGSVAWSPDSKQVLTGSYDKTAKIWDVASGKELTTLQGHINPIYSVAWSPDGRQVLTGSYDKTAKIWDVTSGKELITLQGHTDRVWSVAWSPDGKQILTGSADNTAKIWDVASGSELTTLQGHTNAIYGVAWSPDSKQVLTGSADTTTKIWEVASGKELTTLQGHTDRVWSVVWSPDGKQVLTGSGDGTAKIWEVASGKELTTLQGHSGAIFGVAWSPDGKQVLTGSYDNTAKIWEVTSGKELTTLQGHAQSVGSVAWSPDGKQVLTGSGDGTAKIWEVASGKELTTLQGHTDAIESVAWSPNGKQILTGSADKTAKIWDVASGRELATLQGHTDVVYSVAWSPDGRQVLTGSYDKTAKIWDVASGRELATLQGHTDAVLSVAWSPNGKQILTGSADKTAKIWDVASGRELTTLQGHTNAVYGVAWSPDGKQVLTGSFDNTAKIWIADNRPIIAELTRRVCYLFTDDEIRNKIPSWRGCTAELAAVKDYQAEYDRLRPPHS